MRLHCASDPPIEPWHHHAGWYLLERFAPSRSRCLCCPGPSVWSRTASSPAGRPPDGGLGAGAGGDFAAVLRFPFSFRYRFPTGFCSIYLASGLCTVTAVIFEQITRRVSYVVPHSNRTNTSRLSPFYYQLFFDLMNLSLVWMKPVQHDERFDLRFTQISEFRLIDRQQSIALVSTRKKNNNNSSRR